MPEADPTGRDPHQPGAKLDSGKIMGELLLDFNLAIEEILKVGTFGAKKYTPGGWIEVPEGYRRYTGALIRHLLKERREALDQDMNLCHQAAVAWNALARLELMLRAKERADNGLGVAPAAKG